MPETNTNSLSLQRDTFRQINQKFTYKNALDKIREESFYLASNCRIRDLREQVHYQLSLDSKGTMTGLLDAKLSGGLRTSCINQICGESGSGKSNLCYWMLAHTISPRKIFGAEKGAILVATEGATVERIAEMIPIEYREESLERLLVYKASSCDNLKEILSEILPKIIREKSNISLLILDSIAAVASHLRGFERKTVLIEIGEYLRTISRDFRCVVVVVNQVRSHIGQNPIELPEDGVEWNKPFELVDRRFVPALGLLWRKQIDASFHVVRHGNKRKLIAYHVPWAPYFEVEMLLSDTLTFQEVD